jgi:mRNA-degrading endonuclease toxin of MazEF toxin-antitoxin module
MRKAYVPEASDIVWLQFDPQAGHEQAGHRPAVVLSPSTYNGKTGLMVCCPMTTKIKGHPFEVCIDVDGVNHSPNRHGGHWAAAGARASRALCRAKRCGMSAPS